MLYLWKLRKYIYVKKHKANLMYWVKSGVAHSLYTIYNTDIQRRTKNNTVYFYLESNFLLQQALSLCTETFGSNVSQLNVFCVIWNCINMATNQKRCSIQVLFALYPAAALFVSRSNNHIHICTPSSSRHLIPPSIFVSCWNGYFIFCWFDFSAFCVCFETWTVIQGLQCVSVGNPDIIMSDFMPDSMCSL